jgi:hypothetical protein
MDGTVFVSYPGTESHTFDCNLPGANRPPCMIAVRKLAFLNSACARITITRYVPSSVRQRCICFCVSIPGSQHTIPLVYNTFLNTISGKPPFPQTHAADPGRANTGAYMASHADVLSTPPSGSSGYGHGHPENG